MTRIIKSAGLAYYQMWEDGTENMKRQRVQKCLVSNWGSLKVQACPPILHFLLLCTKIFSFLGDWLAKKTDGSWPGQHTYFYDNCKNGIYGRSYNKYMVYSILYTIQKYNMYNILNDYNLRDYDQKIFYIISMFLIYYIYAQRNWQIRWFWF